MKLIDIVTTLHEKLPMLTTDLTDTLSISSLIHSGTTATVVTTAAHGLRVGDSTHILGAKTPVTITVITHAKPGGVGSGIAIATTATDHDLTLYSDAALNLVTVSGITGASTQLDFNVTNAVLLSVPDRRTFHYTVPITADTTWTGGGSPVAPDASNVYNTVSGQYAVATITNATTFTVEHTAGTSLGTLTGTITARVKPRILAAITDQYAIAAYSQKVKDNQENESEVWLYVVIDDAATSRGRDTRLDTHDLQTIGQDWRQFILQPFSLLLAIPSTADTLGRNARDRAEDLLRPILRAAAGVRFPTGLGISLAGPAQFLGHAFASYDGSVYWHEFRFEQRAEMTVDDTAGADPDVAFRDVDATITPNLDGLVQGAGNMGDLIDLDDVPI